MVTEAVLMPMVVVVLQNSIEAVLARAKVHMVWSCLRMVGQVGGGRVAEGGVVQWGGCKPEEQEEKKVSIRSQRGTSAERKSEARVRRADGAATSCYCWYPMPSILTLSSATCSGRAC